MNFLANPPIFKGTQASPQSVPNAAFTAVALDTNKADTYGGHSTVTNNSRYVAVVPAWYWASGGASWSGNATGVRDAVLAVNGAQVPDTFASGQNSGAGLTAGAGAVPSLIYLNIGDYIELWAYQTSGGNLSISAAGLAVSFSHM